MSKIRQSARGEDCTIRLPLVCSFDPATTVLCHPNTHRAGKGKSIKAIDELGAYGCHTCHAVVDGMQARPEHLRKVDVDLAFWEGHAETFMKLKQKGLV